MITSFITENNSYLIASPFGMIDGEVDFSFFMHPENLTIWKLKGVKNSIMATTENLRDADLIRYESFFKGVLNEEKLMEIIIPKIRKIYKKYLRITSQDTFSTSFYILQKNKGFFISSKGKIHHIKHIDSIYGESFINGFLIDANQMNSLFYVVLAIKKFHEYFGTNVYPIAILDTQSSKVKYIENEGQLWALNS